MPKYFFPRMPGSKPAGSVLLRKILPFLVTLSLVFIQFSAATVSRADELGQRIMEAILSGKKYTNASLLLLTRDLGWYKKNMDKLKKVPGVIEAVENIRLQVAAQSAMDAAEKLGEPKNYFGATGSWKAGSDMDVIYFGNQTEGARSALNESYERQSRKILASVDADEILKEITDLEVPSALSAESMSVVTSSLPDFGFDDLSKAWEEAQEAVKRGESREQIMRRFYEKVEAALAKNAEAHVASTAKDMYHGATGQFWLWEDYLTDPKKMRLFAFDETTGRWILLDGGIKAIPKHIADRIGFGKFRGLEMKFTNVSSNLMLFYEHFKGKGAAEGTIETAKYVTRIWRELEAFDFSILKDLSRSDMGLITTAMLISKNPSEMDRYLKQAGLSLRDLRDKLHNMLYLWTERIMLDDTRNLVNELKRLGSAAESMEKKLQTALLKMEFNELASGLQALNGAPAEVKNRLLEALRREFDNSNEGRAAINYIMTQLRLMSDEGSEVTKRILRMLAQMKPEKKPEIDKVLAELKGNQEIPGELGKQVKQARKEVMVIAAAGMLEFEWGEEYLDRLMESWRKSKGGYALIQSSNKELLELVRQARDLPERELQLLGWDPFELRMMEIRKKLPGAANMKQLEIRLANKFAKAQITPAQFQGKLRELLFNPAYTQLGDEGMTVGALDAFVGVATGLFQTYNILFNQSLPPEDENLELGTAWVTAIPIVGDFAQGSINLTQAGFEGDMGKALEGGLWIAIGVMGCVPGGQLPAFIAGMGLAAKSIGTGVYDARQAQNLIQTWVESGDWTETKPANLKGLWDRNNGSHRITYEDLLTDKGHVYYKSERLKGLLSGESTIAESIRAYAEPNIIPQYPALASLREALKNLYPHLNKKVWDDEFTAGNKVYFRGGEAGKMVFRAYNAIRIKAYEQTLTHLKTWAEEERKAAKDYGSEVTAMREELKRLGQGLRVPSLVGHADESVEAYSRVIKNWWEQESLPLSKLRIYKQYVDAYRNISGRLQRVYDLFREVPAPYIPQSWHLTGYPIFDTPRVEALLASMEQGRKGVIAHIEGLLAELNQKETRFNPADDCHKKAFNILVTLRYKVAFAENLSLYYKQLAEGSGAWETSYNSALQAYKQARDEAGKTAAGRGTNLMELKAVSEFFAKFIWALPYSLASKEADLYRSTSRQYELLKAEAAKTYDLATWSTGEGGKALSACLVSDLSIAIDLSNKEPKAGDTIGAKAVLKKGKLPKEYYWYWKVEGGLRSSVRFGEEAAIEVRSKGRLTLQLLDYHDLKLAKVLTETTMEFSPGKRPLPSVSIEGPTELKAGEGTSFRARIQEELPPDALVEWLYGDQVVGRGAEYALASAQVGLGEISVRVTGTVQGKRQVITSAKHLFRVNPDPGTEKGKIDRDKQEGLKRESLEREQLVREGKVEQERIKEPPACTTIYSDWGECSRETQKQVRSVRKTIPFGCLEKAAPIVEQDCTPPPSPEERRVNFLNCLCFGCQTGLPSMGGHFAVDGECKGMCSCPAPISGSCRLLPPGDSEKIKNCYASHFGVKDPSKADLDKALQIIREQNKKVAKPLQVKLTADKTKPKPGEVVNLRAEVGGGIPGYTYSWTGEHGGKGETVQFTSRTPGTHRLSVRVTDSAGESESAAISLQVVSLTATIEGLGNQAVYGSKRSLSVKIDGLGEKMASALKPEPAKKKKQEDPCYKDDALFCLVCPSPYNEVTCCQESPEKVQAKYPGLKITTSCNDFYVNLIRNAPTRSEKEKAGKEQETAEVKPAAKKTDYRSGVKITWYASKPGVTFDPPQGASTTVQFGRMGDVAIWADVQVEEDGSVTTYEVPQGMVRVVAPSFAISTEPKSGGIGQEIRATVKSTPAVDRTLIDYRWLTPPGSGEVNTFSPRDTKPIELQVLARVPSYGDIISDDIKSTFVAQQYTVKASITGIPETQRARIWKPGVGLVPVDRGTYAADEQVRLKADIEGHPNPSEVRWNWTANGGTTVLSPTSREPAAYRSETGTAELTVSAKDRNGLDLGRATASFSVTVSREVVRQGPKSKEAVDKLTQAKSLVAQGKLDEGISLAHNAVALDPKNTEAVSLSTRWKSDKDKIQDNLKNLQSFLKQEKIPEAEKELSEAEKFHPKYQPVVDADKQVKETKAKVEKQKKDQAGKLIKAKESISQGKLDEAITLIDEIVKLDPKNTEATSLASKWKADKQTVMRHIEAVRKLIPANKIVDAEKEFAEAQKLHPKYGLVLEAEKLIAEAKKRFTDLQKKEDITRTLALAKDLLKQGRLDEAQKTAEELVKRDPGNSEAQNILQQIKEARDKNLKTKTLLSEATALEKSRNYKKALEKYKEANALTPTPEFQNKIAHIESLVKKTQTLLNEGYAAEKQGDLHEALKKYRSAQEIFPDEAVAKKMAELEAKLKDQEQRAQQAQQLRAQGEALQKQNRIPEALAAYREYMKYMPNDQAMAKYINDLENNLRAQQQKAQQADQLRAQGEALQRQNKIPEALAAYREYMKYMPNDQAMDKYINDLENNLRAQQQKAQQAAQLRAQGEALQKQNRIPEALAAYREYMKYMPNDQAMAKYINDLENNLRAQQQKAQQAAQLRAQGEALQRQNKIPEAIAKYKESLTVYPDPQLTDYVRQLETRLAAVTAQSSSGVQMSTRDQGPWIGTWKANGKDNEEVTFVFKQSGSRIAGTYTVVVSISGRASEVFKGNFDGTASGNNARGKFVDEKESRNVGTWEAVISSDSNSFDVIIKGGSLTQSYTARRVR